MDDKIKRSVATLLAHIIKVDSRDVAKEAPLFCKFFEADFECDPKEAQGFLENALAEEYSLDEHIDVINQALKDDILSKMHILEQINRIICSDTITERDYEEFDRIKKVLFP